MLLAQGAEGIAVGLSTRFLPHNFNELIDASIQHLKGKSFKLFPDFHKDIGNKYRYQNNVKRRYYFDFRFIGESHIPSSSTRSNSTFRLSIINS